MISYQMDACNYSNNATMRYFKLFNFTNDFKNRNLSKNKKRPLRGLN